MNRFLVVSWGVVWGGMVLASCNSTSEISAAGGAGGTGGSADSAGAGANTGGGSTVSGGAAALTGGSSSTTAGASGATGGVGGSSGAGTGGGVTPQLCSETAVPNNHISSFVPWSNGIWGATGDLTGSLSIYGSQLSAAFTATVDPTASNPSLRLTATVPAGGYAGFIMVFSYCADASAYSGIRFQVGGTLGGATLDFQVQINDDHPIDVANERGACAGPCSNNHAPVTVTSTLTTVSYAWADLVGGLPAPVDPHQLLGIVWAASCAAATSCAISLTLDTIEFF